MATTGTVDGNAVGIYISDTLIACATSASLDLSTNMSDATCKDNNGAEQIKPNQQTWSMGLDGMLAFDAAYGWSDLVAAWKAGTKLTVKWGTAESGDENYSGDAYIDSLSAQGPLNEASTYSVNFRGSGPLTVGTNP
jgi:predicted secreted protein